MSEVALLPPRLLKVASVARELDCSDDKVRKLIANGTLPVVRIDGMLRVRREDLEALLLRWGIKSTGSESTEASGVPSPGTGATRNEARLALRRQKALGRLAPAARS